jgi:hypothetical protein
MLQRLAQGAAMDLDEKGLATRRAMLGDSCVGGALAKATPFTAPLQEPAGDLPARQRVLRFSGRGGRLPQRGRGDRRGGRHRVRQHGRMAQRGAGLRMRSFDALLLFEADARQGASFL